MIHVLILTVQDPAIYNFANAPDGLVRFVDTGSQGLKIGVKLVLLKEGSTGTPAQGIPCITQPNSSAKVFILAPGTTFKLTQQV